MEEVNADSNTLVRGITSFSSKNWQSAEDDEDSALCAVRFLECDWQLTSFSPGLEAYSLISDIPCQVDTATNSYCYVEPAHDQTPANMYLYQLPIDITFPDIAPQTSDWMALQAPSCCRRSESIGNATTHMRNLGLYDEDFPRTGGVSPALNGRSVGISERISKFSLCPAGVTVRAAANPIEQSWLPGHPRKRDQEVGYEVLWLVVLANAPCLTP